MPPLPAITAVKTTPASTMVRSAAAASSALQSAAQSAVQTADQSTEQSVAPSTQQGQAPVTAYAEEQALRQQQAAAEQNATEQLTETQSPDSGEPAAELFLLSQPLSAEELALLYRQPLISSGFSQPLPAENSNGSITSAVAPLISASTESGAAAMASLESASLAPATLPAQALAEPMLTQWQRAEQPHLLSVSSQQALQQQAVLVVTDHVSQTSTAGFPAGEAKRQHSTLPHSPLQHSPLQQSMAQTSLLNRQFNALNGHAAWLTSTDSSAVNPLSAQASTSSALAQWQSDPLPTEPARFGQRLLQLLQDKVDLQLGLGLNKALIRLDPPSLGSIELSVQLDGDKLQVQLHSNNAQLREAMGQGLEQLRASLQQKLGSELQIELQLSADGQLAREAHPAWMAEQISGNAALSEMAEPLQPVMVEGHNYLNQLV